MSSNSIIKLLIIYSFCFLLSSCINVERKKNIIFNSNKDYYGSINNHNTFVEQRKWKGQWIWLNKFKYFRHQRTYTTSMTNKLKEYRVLFRKTFSINSNFKSAMLYYSADVSCKIYLNGHLISSGPANIGTDLADKIGPKHWFYSPIKIDKYLKDGSNIISAEVYSFDLSSSETTTTYGGFICDLLLDGKTLISTDESWKTYLDKSFSSDDSFYIMDESEIPQNWNSLGFKDHNWDHASLSKSNKERGIKLIKRQIPELYQTIYKPKSILYNIDTIAKTLPIKLNPYDSIIIDYGQNLVGHINFEIKTNNKSSISIFPFEKMGSTSHRNLKYIFNEGINKYETPYYNAYRYLKIKSNSNAPILLTDIYTRFSTYPVQQIGEFSCSDSTLNSTWNTLNWITQLCMHDLILDSPIHQEPIACTGDYLIISKTNYAAFGDTLLPRNNIYKTAFMLEKFDYDIFHTSYSLLWVQMLYDYYLFTGNNSIIKDNLLHVNNLLDKFETYLGKEFLLSNCPDYTFMDWTTIEGQNCHHPPASIGMGYMTALYYKALTIGIELNTIESNNNKKEKYVNLAKKIKSSFNKYLWDNNLKIYKDGIPNISNSKNYWALPKDINKTTYSPHVNILSVLYDLAPKNYHNEILNYCLESKIEVQPYFMYFFFSALKKTNMMNRCALELFYNWDKIIDHESKTIQENWSNITKSGYHGDYSHAWGASPNIFFMNSILGLDVINGKPNTFSFHPNPMNLKWAKGKMPLKTSKTIDVEWKSDSNNFYALIDIPIGNYVKLTPPYEKFKVMYIDSVATNDFLIKEGIHTIHIKY